MDERARAIEAVYRERRFRDVLSSMTGSRELGTDAVQETFARALRDRHAFRGKGSLRPASGGSPFGRPTAVNRVWLCGK